MRVLLPLPIRSGNWLGGSNYFLALVAALRQHPDADAELIVATNCPDVFAEGDSRGVCILDAPWLDAAARIGYRANAACAAVASINPMLYSLARKTGASLVSHVVPGRFAPCPMLFWMPDFQHCHYPEFFSARERASRDRNVEATRRSGHLLVSSEDAAADFRRFFPALAGVKAHVLRFAPLLPAAPAAAAAAQDAALLDRYGLREDFFFLPNQYWRHKNHAVVIEALRLLPDAFQVASTGALSDYRGDGHIQALLKSIERHGLTRRFRLLGVVPREDMMGLMAVSRAVINPSLFEGWSSTVEEAKACGKRLLLSDIGVHREQDPVDAIYFQPHDAAGLAEAMLAVQATFDPQREASRAAEARVHHASAVAGFATRYLEIAREVARSGS